MSNQKPYQALALKRLNATPVTVPVHQALDIFNHITDDEAIPAPLWKGASEELLSVMKVYSSQRNRYEEPVNKNQPNSEMRDKLMAAMGK